VLLTDPTNMSSPTPIVDDTYYISSQLTSTFITGGVENANVTAWQYDRGLDQQVLILFFPVLSSLMLCNGNKWVVSGYGAAYTFRNKQYGTYIFYETTEFLLASLTPSLFIIQPYKGGFV
jgi:hypothetical protein